MRPSPLLSGGVSPARSTLAPPSSEVPSSSWKGTSKPTATFHRTDSVRVGACALDLRERSPAHAALAGQVVERQAARLAEALQAIGDPSRDFGCSQFVSGTRRHPGAGWEVGFDFLAGFCGCHGSPL